MSKGVLSHPNDVLGGTFVSQLTCPRGFLVIQCPRVFLFNVSKGVLKHSINVPGRQIDMSSHPNNVAVGSFVCQLICPKVVLGHPK